MEGVHLAKGGNVLEYRAKVNALSKPKALPPFINVGFKRTTDL
jgi:hypothetical protein